MNKEVKYNGYSAQPSDYECQDGELSVAINLIPEENHLRPIPEPFVYPIDISGFTALMLHKVALQQNLIFLSEVSSSVYRLAWMPFDEDNTSGSNSPSIIAPDCEPLYGYKDISIVGNTICAVDASGVHYFIWRDGNYHYIGNKPPFVSIAFKANPDRAGDVGYTSSTSYDSIDVPIRVKEMLSPTGGNGGTRPNRGIGESAAFWKNIENQALGLLLSTGNGFMGSGRIYQPCFIRYAFKYYDGSYAFHSAPILVAMTKSMPAISVSGSEHDGQFTISCRTEFKSYTLNYRILDNVNNLGLESWKDIIIGIDIFMSAPIYTFDQSDIEYGLVRSTEIEVNYSSNRYSNRATSRDDAPEDESRSDGELRFIALKPKCEFVDNICSESNFYKIASIELENISKMLEFKHLPLIDKDFTNIVSRERLPDDYNSHSIILPDNTTVYNNRLFLSGLQMRPPKPFNLSSSVESIDNHWDLDESIPINAEQKIFVRTILNGRKCYSVSHASVVGNYYYPIEKKFPRFIYLPDPNAYSLFIVHPANKKLYEFPLKRHPLLNGTYWFYGLGDKPQDVIETTLNSTSEADEFFINEAPWRNDYPGAVKIGGTVYVSPVNNPFIFPPENTVSIDGSIIMGLSTAAKALSQGQFGQFPLYAFTDSGVWAMEISSTGSISARQPISRDVCISPDGITQLDSAVLFPTERGIMHIIGSEVQCISDPINNIEPLRIQNFPGIQAIIDNTFPGSSKRITEIAPLKLFLTDKCRMVYDYVHQRIIVFNPDYPYSYVYSLKSKLWGMLVYDINRSLNSYPSALAITSNGALVNLSKADNTLPNPMSIILTRPLKLDAANIHKTIDNIIQRGNFAKGHVQSVLYGSRDLINWHLVWSSKDHFLRGFRGTPYKYFRVALLCNLSQGESIYGASVQFTPRLINQPR